MNHIKSINELFGFLKKKFSQDEIDSVESLFSDTVDELALSNKDISLRIVFDDYKAQLMCTIKIEPSLFNNVMESDEIRNFFKTLEVNFKVIRGLDVYTSYDSMSGAFEFTKNKIGGLYKFKLMKK